jgi:hypothetical protein
MVAIVNNCKLTEIYVKACSREEISFDSISGMANTKRDSNSVRLFWTYKRKKGLTYILHEHLFQCEENKAI